MITVRNATERDGAAIAKIQASSPEAAQWPVGDYSNYATLLAQREGLPCGFCSWRQLSEEEAELLNLAVDPGARRRGVAAALLQALLTAAKGDVFLEVAETNHAAVALYVKLGWEAISRRKGYYGGGSVDAVVMKKRSWYSPG